MQRLQRKILPIVFCPFLFSPLKAHSMDWSTSQDPKTAILMFGAACASHVARWGYNKTQEPGFQTSVITWVRSWCSTLRLVNKGYAVIEDVLPKTSIDAGVRGFLQQSLQRYIVQDRVPYFSDPDNPNAIKLLVPNANGTQEFFGFYQDDQRGIDKALLKPVDNIRTMATRLTKLSKENPTKTTPFLRDALTKGSIGFLKTPAIPGTSTDIYDIFYVGSYTESGALMAPLIIIHQANLPAESTFVTPVRGSPLAIFNEIEEELLEKLEPKAHMAISIPDDHGMHSVNLHDGPRRGAHDDDDKLLTV